MLDCSQIHHTKKCHLANKYKKSLCPTPYQYFDGKCYWVIVLLIIIFIIVKFYYIVLSLIIIKF